MEKKQQKKQHLWLWSFAKKVKPASCLQQGCGAAGNPGLCVWSLLLFLLTEGMLTLRARPPSEAEFIDSLQKLKLALNLLVRYQSF